MIKKSFLPVLFFVALFFCSKAFAYVETKTGQIQLNSDKLLSSTLVKEGDHWCTTAGWNRVCYSHNLYNDCTLLCNNTNNYTYSFNYDVKKNGSSDWKPLETKDLFKCDTARFQFSPIGDWGANLDKNCVDNFKDDLIYSACWSHSPPTDIIACKDKEDCLYKAKGYDLTPDYSGKGVQQVPDNFVDNVSKSLASNPPDNICTPGCTSGDVDCAKCGQDGVCMPGCSSADPDCATVGTCSQDNICVAGCKDESNPDSVDDPDCAKCGQEGSCVAGCSATDPDCSTLGVCNKDLICANGQCPISASGKFQLNAFVPETKYYGECKGYTMTLDPDPAPIPSYVSKLDLSIVNRPPVATVSLSGQNPGLNEEITATCDVVDPDSCSDKITEVKWACFNNKKEEVGCYFGQDGIFREGSLDEEVPSDKQSSSYRSTVKFKAGTKDAYAITCSATDSDPSSVSTGIGVGAVGVGYNDGSGGTCSQDNICVAGCAVTDPDCAKCTQEGTCIAGCATLDPDCGVIAAKMNFCAVLSEVGSTSQTVCGSNAKVSLKAYQFGMEPSEYKWRCDEKDQFVTGGDSKECAYSQGGKYVPGLKVFDNKSKTWIDCTSDNNTVTVASKAKCSVVVRPKGSNDNYVPQIKISAGDQLEAKVQKECASSKDEISWSTDGVKGSQSANKLDLTYSTAGFGYVKANVGSTVCTGASVEISQKIKMGSN